MSKSLGYDDTLGQDADYDDAKDHFEDDLGLTDDEAEERLAKMGYDEKLKNTDKVRLVENPKKFMEEYIESILAKKSKDSEIVSNDGDQMEEKEINPIVAKQLKSLKNSLKSHNLSINDIMKHLKDNE
jgi:phosphoribosyl-ATP pyrophosphohydrolase